MKVGIRSIIKELIPDSLIMRKLHRDASDCVLLTFDDGPDTTITPAVLELLGEYGIRAIFFVVGHRVLKAPNILSDIQEKGHIIGNHTYIHSNGPQPGFLAYLKDLQRCQAVIEEITGSRPTLFRSPGGRISPVSVVAAQIAGLRTVLWSIDGGEWGRGMRASVHAVVEELSFRIKPRDIVLLHDDHPKTPEILNLLISSLKAKNLDLFSGINWLRK